MRVSRSFPKASISWQDGTLYVTETPHGIELTSYNPEFVGQMEVAERIMREDRDVLRKLAGNLLL